MALNHATGLRFLHYEDVAVGVWVSGMRLQFITDWDIGYQFVGHANLWNQEGQDMLKVSHTRQCLVSFRQALMPALCQVTRSLGAHAQVA